MLLEYFSCSCPTASSLFLVLLCWGLKFYTVCFEINALFFFLLNVDLQSNRSRNHLKLSRSHGAPLKSRKHEKHAVLVNTAPSSVHALDSYSYTFIHFADAFYPKQFTTYNPSLELLMESIKFTSNDFFIDVQVLSKDLVPRVLPEGWFGFEINFYPVFTANSNPKADFHHFGKRKVSMCVARDT